jgi:hypothetical protein
MSASIREEEPPQEKPRGTFTRIKLTLPKV